MDPPLQLILDHPVPADLATVNALARLQLAARRAGEEIRLVDLPEDLRALIELAGLTAPLRVEP
jgi:ABC-type transporter Mla MlaB component